MISDMEPSSAQMASGNSTQALMYKKLQSVANITGQKYEYKMASLLYLRGVNHTDGFYMGANVDGAGAFDDVVFKYKPRGEQEYRTCFLQFKHNAAGTGQVDTDSMIETEGDFSLYKYYQSFCQVARNVNDEEYRRCDLFDIDLNSCDFVIFTNAIFDKSLPVKGLPSSEAVAGAKIFATGESSKTQTLAFSDENIKKIEEQVQDRLALEETLQLNDKRRKWTGLQEVSEKFPVEGFLQRLQWFTEQASEQDLDALIEAEIEAALQTVVEVTREIAKSFVKRMQQWWEGSAKKPKGLAKERKGSEKMQEVLTEAAHLWSDIIDSRLPVVNALKMAEMTSLEISFTGDEKETFNQSLSGVVNVTSDNVKLTSLKIYQTIKKYHTNRFIFMQQDAMLSNKVEVLRAWQSEWCDFLAIECSTDAKTVLDVLHNIPAGKQLILLSEFPLHGYNQYHDNFAWSQLESQSQTRLLEMEVDFQGHNVTLASVVGEHTHALTGDVVSQLLTPGTKLTIGAELDEQLSFYIARNLERRDYITRKVFHSVNQNDYFIISNVMEEDVNCLGATYGIKLIKYDETQSNVTHHFFWVGHNFSANDVTRFRTMIPGGNVHWLSIDESKSIYWRHSFKNVTMIKQNLTRSKVRSAREEDVSERVVLLTSEPGMGKSTLLTHLAQEAKKRDNSEWVIRVHLSNITNQLRRASEDYFKNKVNVAEFLLAPANVSDCIFGKDILRCRLLTSGKVSVFLDGFDEVSLHYSEKVLKLIKSIMKLNIRQLWITSRITMLHLLENKLKSICYSIKPFTEKDQVAFFTKYYRTTEKSRPQPTISGGTLGEFAKTFFKTFWKTFFTSESENDTGKGLTANPLHCRMIAEVIEDDLKKFESTEIMSLAKHLDLLDLYERFVEKKMRTYIVEKEVDDATSAQDTRRMEQEKLEMRQRHTNAAMSLLLFEDEMKLLEGINEKKLQENVDQNFTQPEDRTGLIEGMHENKPRFMHRTFAEYFAALWLSNNISSSSAFFRDLLFESRFTTVRRFVDLLLARDCQMHRAVLSADTAAVTTLLTSDGADVNSRDEGGRTALHFAVSYPDIGKEANSLKLLLGCGANASLQDTLLGWTPMRYADKTESWAAMEPLLEKGASTEDMVETKKLVCAINDNNVTDAALLAKSRTAIENLALVGGIHTMMFLVDGCTLGPDTDLHNSSEEEEDEEEDVRPFVS